MRAGNIVMACVGLIGVACGLWTLSLSTTPAGGLTWAALVVLNAMLAGANARDAIQDR